MLGGKHTFLIHLQNDEMSVAFKRIKIPKLTKSIGNVQEIWFVSILAAEVLKISDDASHRGRDSK